MNYWRYEDILYYLKFRNLEYHKQDNPQPIPEDLRVGHILKNTFFFFNVSKYEDQLNFNDTRI